MNLRYGVVGVVIVGALVGGIFFIQKTQAKQNALAPARDSAKIKGAGDAQIQIIEYSDFQCPACKRAQSPLNKILETYSGDVQVVFRHFPLKAHRWAALAHQSAECANKQGKFWPFHDQLFDQQSTWSASPNPTQTFIIYAKTLGLDLDAFATCLTDEAVKAEIVEEKKTGVDLKVQSTPTFFINGERVVGGLELSKRGNDMIREKLGRSA